MQLPKAHRADIGTRPEGRCYIRRIAGHYGGTDRGGHYWPSGPVWWLRDQAGTWQRFILAPDRKSAVQRLRQYLTEAQSHG